MLGQLNNNKEGLPVTHDDLQRPVQQQVIPEISNPRVFSGFTRVFGIFCLLTTEQQ